MARPQVPAAAPLFAAEMVHADRLAIDVFAWCRGRRVVGPVFMHARIVEIA